jgi:hypothetical protein
VSSPPRRQSLHWLIRRWIATSSGRTVEVRKLSTHVDNQRRSRDQRIAHLQHQKDDAERELARLRREAAQQPLPDYAGPAYGHGDSRYGPRPTGRGRDTAVMRGHYSEPEVADDAGLFAYGAPADADAAYADPSYADPGYADPGYGDAADGDRAFEDEPFEDEPFPDERAGVEAFSDESYRKDESDGDPFGSDASGSDASGIDDSGSESIRGEAADPEYPEPASEDPAPAGSTGGDGERSRDGRTERLVTRGRWSAQSPWLSRKRLIAVGAAAGLLLILILVLVLTGSGASWPASVATVQNEIAKACQNGDVASEPGQVNFACGKTTRQVLWVFSLLTSNDNPHFNDLKTGRVGLEPITPSEGGEVAWSLNLHHPYSPDDPIDSLQVAARAINNIVGGATLTASGGSSVVQPGLESNSANCLRYTGSARLRVRKGFPSVCARPVTVPAGQAALVADVYQKWMVGASAQAAQEASVLFENANNPGHPQVQAILSTLPGAS